MNTHFDFKAYVQDSADRMVGHRDQNQSIFVENLLTETLRQLYLKRYPEVPWGDGTLVDIDTSANPGANGIQWEMLGDVGLFQIVADDADDLPQVDIEGDTNYNKANTVAAEIRYSQQQLQASEMQGMFNIASQKADAAKRSYVRTLNGYIRVGSTAHSFPGMANLPGRFNLASTGAWSGLTPSQIQADFVRAFDATYNGTGSTFMPDTVVFPSSVRGTLLRQNSVATNDNILNWMKSNYDMIKTWIFDYGMNTSGSGSTDAMIMFNSDPLVCGALVPEYLVPLPVQPVGLSFRIPFKSRYAGIRNTNPGTVATMYGL